MWGSNDMLNTEYKHFFLLENLELNLTVLSFLQVLKC